MIATRGYRCAHALRPLVSTRSREECVVEITMGATPGEGHRCGTALENGDFEKESVRVVDGGALAASRDIGLLTCGRGDTWDIVDYDNERG